MKKIKDLLAELELFQDLEPDMLEYIAGCCKNEHFGPGDYMGREGDPADTSYVLRSGRVSVQLTHPNRGELTIKTLGPGEIGGFSWFFPPYRWHFDLKALQHTSVVSLNGKCVREKCEQDHKLGYMLMKKFASVMEKRLKDTRIQLLDMYNVSA